MGMKSLNESFTKKYGNVSDSLKPKKSKPITESMKDEYIVTLLLEEYGNILETDYSFDESLNDFLDTITIYHSDNLKWFTTAVDTMFELGMQQCQEYDSYTTDFDDFVRGALTNLIYNYTYSYFEEVYREHTEDM